MSASHRLPRPNQPLHYAPIADCQYLLDDLGYGDPSLRSRWPLAGSLTDEILGAMSWGSEAEGSFSSFSLMSVEERKRRARRQTILEAAALLFARYGLESATIEKVAREAKVAVVTI